MPVFAVTVVHVVPLVERSIMYPVTGKPPVSAGAVHVNTACALPTMAETFIGAEAGALGIAGATFDASPLPADVTALTRIRIVTPLSSPVNVYDVATEFVFATSSVHVVPPSTLDSMR